jgi:hypothetical protein
VNEFGSNVECHRRELPVHCYRMLGSLPDVEDAVQETGSANKELLADRELFELPIGVSQLALPDMVAK